MAAKGIENKGPQRCQRAENVARPAESIKMAGNSDKEKTRGPLIQRAPGSGADSQI